MNEIEKALKFLETEKQYMFSHGGEYQVNACDIAIQALQEKQSSKLLDNAMQLVGQDFNSHYDYVLACVEEKQERDLMKCENCYNSYSKKRTRFCKYWANELGTPYSPMVDNNDFCSNFELKKNTNIQ